jgi:hypothetical protein
MHAGFLGLPPDYFARGRHLPFRAAGTGFVGTWSLKAGNIPKIKRSIARFLCIRKQFRALNGVYNVHIA